MRDSPQRVFILQPRPMRNSTHCKTASGALGTAAARSCNRSFLYSTSRRKRIGDAPDLPTPNGARTDWSSITCGLEAEKGEEAGNWEPIVDGIMTLFASFPSAQLSRLNCLLVF